MNKIYFCYVAGLRGPTPILLYGLEQNINSNSKQKQEILQKREILDHNVYPLETYAKMYPYEVKDEKAVSN